LSRRLSRRAFLTRRSFSEDGSFSERRTCRAVV
jgi:hypothetical protein